MKRFLSCVCALALVAGGSTRAAVTTLNPSDKAANATLSNGNLTVTTTTTPYSAVRSTTSHSTTGKYVYEFTFDSVGGTSAIAVGIGTATASLTTIPGGDVNGISYTLFQNQVDGPGGGACCTGNFGTVIATSVFMVAIDLGSKDIWIEGPNGLWNGDVLANPATGVHGLNSGTYFATGLNAILSSAVFAMVAVFDNSRGTANFGATAMTHSIPAGFDTWDPQPSSAVCSLASTGSGPC